jgi:hypothetical protein
LFGPLRVLYAWLKVSGQEAGVRKCFVRCVLLALGSAFGIHLLHCFCFLGHGLKGNRVDSALSRDLYENARFRLNIISLVRSREDRPIVDETRNSVTEIDTCNGECLSGDYLQ